MHQVCLFSKKLCWLLQNLPPARNPSWRQALCRVQATNQCCQYQAYSQVTQVQLQGDLVDRVP